MCNMCKWPHDKEAGDSENEEINIIKSIIKEDIQDENFTNFMEIILLVLLNQVRN